MTTIAKPSHLEPRIARLEAGLEALAKDISSLSVTVHEQAGNVEKEIQSLTVAVTRAAAPRETNWGTLISAFTLILALGAAAFWPLNQTVKRNHEDLLQLEDRLQDHLKLPLHPVGAALLERIEKETATREIVNQKALDALDKKLQVESALAGEALKQQILLVDTKIQREIQLIQERADARMSKLEATDLALSKLDAEELRNWRNKAMGLTAPSQTVPLVPREVK